GVLGSLFRVVAAVEAQDLALAVDLGHQVHRPLPHPLQCGQRVTRVVELEVDTLVVVAQEQLGTVLEIAVLHIDEGLPEVGELEQQPFLDLLELAGLDLPVAAALVEAKVEKLLLAAELEREEFVDEGDIVVELAHLEDLAPPEPEPLVPAPTR